MTYIQELRIHGGSDGKEPACHVGNLSSIPGLGRSPGEGNGNPLQYSCLENPVDRGAWQATVHGVAESDMTEQQTQTKQTQCKNLLDPHSDLFTVYIQFQWIYLFPSPKHNELK